MYINKISFMAAESRQPNGKTGFLENFYNKTRNQADMTDAIMVPRTIFKGYLGIMTGTTLVTLGAIANKKPALSKFLNVTGLLTSLYGTWSFVRPFVIKDTKGVVNAESLNKKNL